MGQEQGLDPRSQLGVAIANFGKKCLPLCARASLEGSNEEGFFVHRTDLQLKECLAVPQCEKPANLLSTNPVKQ
jgi:hypothetical protein